MKTINKPLAMTLFLLVIAFPVCGLAAYKAYSGPKLPKDQVAIVTPKTSFWSSISPVIGGVDGQKVSMRLTWRGSVAVKPGKHTLAVRLESCPDGSCRAVTPHKAVSFEAEAGHTYILHGQQGIDGSVFWIVDKKTKEVVAGQKPPKKKKKKKKKK